MVKYRITIDRENCAGDRACCKEAPATFDVDAEFKSFVTDPDGDPPADILFAAKGCRVQAIMLHDAKTGKQAWPNA